MVGSRIAHYQISRQIGEGGMGTVYEATDERDGKRVALKVMRAEFTRSREALTRFFNEARATNLVEHPGLVRIYEHGQATDGTAYLAMELLQGETLGARLRRYRGPMSEVEARRIGWQLASGLAAAHKKSIVHRERFTPSSAGVQSFQKWSATTDPCWKDSPAVPRCSRSRHPL